MIDRSPVPRSYYYLLFTLIFSLLVISLLSFYQIQIPIGQYSLKDSGLRDFFIRKEAIAFKADSVVHKPRQEKRDSTTQRFLLIGDSMIEFLRLHLNDYCRHNNHKLYTVIWFSSQTKWFGTSDTLAYYIKKYKPTYVLFSLGSNELFVPNVKKTHQKYVDQILKQMGDLPFIWIGPPNWKEDMGINDLILENVGPKRFFPSKDLTFTRLRDGAHPDKPSAFKWADSIASFLHNKALHKVVMNRPDTFLHTSPPTEILEPKKD